MKGSRPVRSCLAVWPVVALAALTAAAMIALARSGHVGGTAPDDGAGDRKLAADVQRQAAEVAQKWQAVQTRETRLPLLAPSPPAIQESRPAQIAAPAAKITGPSPEYGLGGAAAFAGRRYAWLNGRLYDEGAVTEAGVRLAQIGKDYVVLIDKQGARRVVRFSKE